jgi:PAS domain S-box-containing protein
MGKGSAMKKEVGGFKFKWHWVALLVLLAGLVLTGGYNYYLSETNRIIDEKQKELITIGELKAKQISRWREERVLDADPIVRSLSFKDVFFTWFDDRSNRKAEDRLLDRLSLFKEIERYHDAFIVDQDGMVLISTSERTGQVGPDTMKCIQRVAESKQTKLSNLHMSVYDKIPVIDTMAPILDTSGALKAILLLRSSPDTYLYPLLKTWPIPSDSSEAIIVRRHDGHVIFLSPRKYEYSPIFSEVSLDTDLPAVKAVTGIVGIYTGPDYRSVPVMAYLGAIADSSWFLVCKVDLEELYKETKYKRTIIIMFSVTVAFLLLLSIAFIYRSQQATVLNRLYLSELKGKETQEKFELMFNFVPMGVMHIDASGIITACNDQFVQIIGSSRDKLIGLNTIKDITDDKMIEAIALCLDGQTGFYEGYYTSVTADKTTPVKCEFAPIKVEDRVQGGIGLIRDVTHHKQSEQAIQISELRYRKLFEKARDGILILDFDTGKILDVNPYLIEILGYSHSEFLNRYVWEVSPFRDTALNKDAFDNIKRSGYTRYEDLPLETKSGKKIDVEFVSNSYPVNGQTYVQCNVRDTTERVILQKRQDFIIDTLKLLNRPFTGTKTIEDLLTLIQQYTDIEAIAIRLQDGEDYPYFVYRGFDKKFIKLENSLCSRDSNRCVIRDSEGKPLLECMCGCVIRGQTDSTYPFFTKKGSFWTNSTSTLISGSLNIKSRNTCNVEGYESLAIIPLSTGPEIIGSLQLNDRKVGVFNDSLIQFMEELALIIGVAVRRTWQEDRIKLLEVAKTKDQLQSSRLLNSGIAHELRTPMQALLNCLELIREEVGGTCSYSCDASDEQECPMKKPVCASKASIMELVDDGLERTEYSVKVLNSLSEYSKIASADEVHLINVVPELKTIMRTLMFTDQFKCMKDDNFILSNLDEEDGCFVSINRVDFSQLITNLCRNSREAIINEEPKIEIIVAHVVEGIQITIIDNGKGIDKALGNKIFEPYFSTKENPDGYNQGLGLAMVRDIIAAYGGIIKYNSQPGHTEFIITLPCENTD